VHVQGGFLFPSENHCFSLRKDKQDKDRQKRQGQRQARHKDRQKRQKRQGTHFCLSLSCLSFLSCPCLFCLSLSCLSFLREKQCFSEGKKKKPLSGKEEEEKRAETKNPPLDVQWVHVHVLGHPLDVERKVPRLRTRCSRNRFTRGQLLPICRHHGGVCASLSGHSSMGRALCSFAVGRSSLRLRLHTRVRHICQVMRRPAAAGHRGGSTADGAASRVCTMGVEQQHVR
jgi:hypothetical protein